jgi:putative restriction endonuclease
MLPLSPYFKQFSKLTRGVTQYGKAPHKVVMLLSVLQSFKSKSIVQNRIEVTPELVFLFKTNWSALVNTGHVCNFALPFWHLKGEPFWHLQARFGYEKMMHSNVSVSSLGVLNTYVMYAQLDADLFQLCCDDASNDALQQHLLTQYFPDAQLLHNQAQYATGSLFDELGDMMVNENAAQYQTEIKALISQNNEEEVFIRGGMFKRMIPKIYQNTCCISGWRVDAISNISMIDACHIIPFAESHDDTITNGIALCPNLHRAFDRGLIGINQDYRVVLSKHFKENDATYQLTQFEGKEILLPEHMKHHPSKEALRMQLNTMAS